MNNVTPLRYPGGKAALADLLQRIVELNHLGECDYGEPFAGGAGAALELLFGEVVQSIHLNDLDPGVAAFWKSILTDGKNFAHKIRSTRVSVAEWRRQRSIYLSTKRVSMLARGFATFYLNRCNRSGIIRNAGPIGGIKQAGDWKIDVRFNKESLQQRIDRIYEYRDRISVTRLDALKWLRQVANKRHESMFVYLDPPYFKKGPSLYLNALDAKYHAQLAGFLKSRAKFPWVMTYDDTPEIRDLYGWCRIRPFSLRYSAREKCLGREILIATKDIKLPTRQTSKAVAWLAA